MGIPNPYRGLRGLPADVWIIAATTFVNRAGMMALPFLVLYLTKYLGVSVSLAGLAITAYGVGGLITAPLAGRLADRVGPYTVMRAALGLSGVLLLIIPLVHRFAGILALVLVWAVVADAARPATMAALTQNATPEQRRAAVAVNRLAINLGMSIGPAVGGFLAVVSFPLIFIVDGLTSLAASGLLSILLWYRHRAARENPMPGHAAEHSSARTTRLVWHHRAAMVLFLAVFLVNAVFTQHEGALPVFLVRDLHFRESFYGLLFVVNTLTIVVVEVPLNLAMAHWSPRRVIPIAAVLIATGFGALAFARTPLAIVGTVVIWTFGEMMLFPTVTSYIAELAPPGRTGEYMGVLSATFSLALIVGPWAGGAVLDHFGAVPLWAGSFACAALGAAVFFVLANPPVLRGVR